MVIEISRIPRRSTSDAMPPEITILLVDDNPQDRHLVLRELRKAYPQAMILQALDQAQFDRVVSTSDFDVVVTDYHLHWSDGIQVLRAIKARAPNCPVIMFTGTGNEEVAVEAMKHGLDDYIIKSVQHLVRLRAAVKSVLERARDRASAREANYRLDLLLAHLDVGVFTCTPQGQFIELNDSMVRFLNCATMEEARRKGLNGLVEDAERTQRLLDRVVATKARQEFEIERPDPSGGHRCYCVNANLSSDGQRPLRIDGLVEDITSRKRSEADARAAAVAAAQVAMLSPRERQVLTHVVAGEANKVVARRLDISEKTVEKHRSSLMKKMNVRTIADLVRVSMLAGVLVEE
jgi:FixJ family two-component response regulator